MNRGVYSVANGLIAYQNWMDVTASNLANTSTTGFKQDVVAFNDAMQRQLAANGGLGESVGSLGSGSTVKSAYVDMAQGPLNRTSNPLDVAITGTGYFAVQTAAGITYTRDGAFALDTSGRLVDKHGNPVLDPNNQTISVPSGQISIAQDGTMSVTGQAGFAKIGLFTGDLVKSGDNSWTPSPGTQATAVDTTQAGAPTITQGTLEGSNVSPLISMIDMVKAGRSVELSQKAIQSQDEMTQKLITAMNP